MDEHMREKETVEIQADADERKQEEARIMAKLNGISQPINLNHETIVKFDEHMREKEMAEIQVEVDIKKQEGAKMMTKLNGTFDYSEDALEETVHKRR